jgi:APA family basic amino acid/polyamine antiporter
MEIYGYSPTLISLISLIAIINGALVQVIMASRVLYGLARQGGAPSYLASVNSSTRTPVIATVLVTLAVAVLALLFPLASLAKMTSIIVLAVFVLVNVSLIKIKIDDDKSPESFAVPLFVPFGGAFLSAALLLMAIFA